MEEYPWYTLIDNSPELFQGDLIPDCPIVNPPIISHVGETPEVEISYIDSIILSQSCDLANSNISIVLVCPFLPLKTFIDSINPEQPVKLKETKKIIENLRKGFYNAYHLLNKFDGHLDDYIVVDFKNVYGIHFNTLQRICTGLTSRVRLLPPYREHLAQSFARYFMRVGLPQNIEITGY